MEGNTLFHITFLFVIILDPFGNLPIFVSLLKDFEPKRQRVIIIREMLIALGLMIVFLLFGHAFFRLLHVETAALQMAGGIILFLIAIKMVFATPKPPSTVKIREEPFIVPLAVPAVAGPAILAAIILYGGGVQGSSKLTAFFAILIAWGISLPFLLIAPQVTRFLSRNGIVAIERLFGYLVVLISTEMALSGLLSGLQH